MHMHAGERVFPPVDSLPRHGSVADVLDQSLIGFHAPETLNSLIHNERTKVSN